MHRELAKKREQDIETRRKARPRPHDCSDGQSRLDRREAAESGADSANDFSRTP